MNHGINCLITYDKKTRILRLGTIGSMALGVIAAILVDKGPITALTGAIAGPHVIEQVTYLITKKVK